MKSDGKRLGIPAERSARFLLYDASWAHDLGFNSAPATADDFRQQACAAHAAMLKDQDRSNDGMGGWLVDTQADDGAFLAERLWRRRAGGQ